MSSWGAAIEPDPAEGPDLVTPLDGRVSTIGARATAGAAAARVDEHVLEIVSDSGEGAQKAGQIFGAVSAKMGNGTWTVEIIPAEIRPPPRSRAGASGIRIRFGSRPITNMGDAADVVVGLNEQVLYSRIDQGAYLTAVGLHLGQWRMGIAFSQGAGGISQIAHRSCQAVGHHHRRQYAQHDADAERAKSQALRNGSRF